MIEIFLSIVLYTIFGFAGIFASKKIKFIQKNFHVKQNLIYLSIFYIVYGFFLGQLDTGNLGIAYQIGFGLGNFLSALAGAIIATYFVTNYKFSFKNKLFGYALFGSIVLGTVLTLLLWGLNMTELLLSVFVLLVVLMYLFRPTSKNEKDHFNDKNNWRGGF